MNLVYHFQRFRVQTKEKKKQIMFHLKLKGISKVGLGVVCGVVSAILGAFFGWILIPALVALNVDKVNILFFFWLENRNLCKMCLIVRSTANRFRRRNRTIWAMGECATTITIQSVYIQCEQSEWSDWRRCTKSQRNWPIYLSVSLDQLILILIA